MSSFKSVFVSVVVVAFQIVFYAEIYVNDVFLFFKNYFLHQHIKIIQNAYQNYSKRTDYINF